MWNSVVDRTPASTLHRQDCHASGSSIRMRTLASLYRSASLSPEDPQRFQSTRSFTMSGLFEYLPASLGGAMTR